MDLIWSLAALVMAVALRYGGISVPGGLSTFIWYLPMAYGVLSVWTLLYFQMNLDEFHGGWHIPTIVSRIIVAVFLLSNDVCFGNCLPVQTLLLQVGSSLLRVSVSCPALLGCAFSTCALLAFDLLIEATPKCVILGNGPIAREIAKKD